MALQHKAKKVSAKEVVKAIDNLVEQLESLKAEESGFDKRLADYVFFPLSYIFRNSTVLPQRAVERSLKCLQILITCGWKAQVEPELLRQLLILLSYLASGSMVNVERLDVGEEIGTAAFECLHCLLQSSTTSTLWSLESLSHEENMPLKGHLVTVILGGITKGPSSKVQLVATQTLNALISVETNERVLENFTPGVVSSLLKVLKPSSESRRAYRVLEGCLDSMTKLISIVFRDCNNSGSFPSGGLSNINPSKLDMGGRIYEALLSVVQLRYHDRAEVQEALFRLCMKALQDCRTSLSQSASLMIETAIIVCSQGIVTDTATKSSAIQNVIGADHILSDVLKRSLYAWVVALPRAIRSKNDVNKQRIIAQISSAIEILHGLDVNYNLLDDAIALNIQESVTTIISACSPKVVDAAAKDLFTGTMIPQTAQNTRNTLNFTSIFSGDRNVDGILYGIEKLLKSIKCSGSAKALERRLIESISKKSSNSTMASLWLASKLLTDVTLERNKVDTYLDLPTSVHHTQHDFLDVVYCLCIDVLSAPTGDDSADWRLEGIALEVVVLQSCQKKQDFRPELVDALYPVVERLGSKNALLRQHATSCIDVMSKACGYASSSELLIQNVDYLVNAVALRFNTFDISPQAPQVLLMMISLCGPALIPYLDDIVESVFSALACFHGYPRLVESLFIVLGAIVDEGGSLRASTFEAPLDLVHQKAGYRYTSLLEVANVLKEMRAQSRTAASMEAAESPPSTSRSDSTVGSISVTGAMESIAPTKTYEMIKSIARLGQHYLTHDSSNLRTRLLQLTSRACTALCRNEDEFLPLINDIWPMVVKRLYDPEPFVSMAAADTVSQILRLAGDFMSSRMETEWPDIRILYWQVHKRMVAEKRGINGRGMFTTAHQIWVPLVKLMISVVNFARIDANMEDDIMDMLSGYINSRSDVREALTVMNADAVWLEVERLRQHGGQTAPTPPCLEDFIFESACL